MPNIIGTDVVSLRTIFRKYGLKAETAFVEKLNPELKHFYQTIMHAKWSPVEKQTELYECAAAALFPGAPDALVQLGRALAGVTYTSVYRFLMKIPTISFVLHQSPATWRRFHDTGEAAVENFTKTSADFIVRGYPTLPLSLRGVICGHLAALLEIIGLSEVKVTLHEKNPQAWRWHGSWK